MTETTTRPADLGGRAALVTGAGRGIGKSLAGQLAALGTSVVAVARSGGELARTVAEIRGAGGRAHALVADLSDPEAVEEVAQRATSIYGRIEILVNNAATVQPLGPTTELDWRSVRSAFDLNLTSVVALSAALVPGMVTGGWGRVVNVSSGVVDRPASMVGGNTYVATKSALEAHTLNLAAELDATGVTVNVYRPGTVDTAMQAHVREQDPAVVGAALVDRFRAMHSSGSLVTPDESARTLVARLRGGESGAVWSHGAG